MKQLSIFGSERREPTFEEMRYIARLLKVWMPEKDKPKEREAHLARLLKAVRPEVEKWKEALKRDMFEPNIPEILLFWAIYGEERQETEG
jgi:hypothetical protein